MGETMTFEQLYNHMETYVKDENERWKLVTRVKRGISDPNTVGSYARDQAYFEGACRILENIDNIDFKLLMSGKICLDELDSLADVAKLENIRLPKFFKNMKKYKEKIRQIAVVNGLIEYKPESAESKNGLAQDIDDLKTNVEDSIPEEECEVNYHTHYKDYKKLYLFNKKFYDLDSETIRKFIREEIIPNTKKNPVLRLSGHKKHDHDLCTLL